MQRLRVGIVGCGEVTQIMHLPTLRQLDEQFTVMALCDVSANVLNGVGDLWGITARETDFHALVTRDDVDVVLVANPNAFHAEVTLAALAAGKQVMLEKPMCMNLREADAIIEAQRQAGKIVQVGFMRRYAPSFVEACRAVKAMGTPRMARVHDVIGRNAQIITPTSNVLRGGDVPQAALDAAAQRNYQLTCEAIGDAPPALERAYNLLLGLSTHDISAMREILGMPQRVLYAAQRSDGNYVTAAFDYGDFVCQFETGVDLIARFDCCIEVYGDEQVIRVDYDTPYVRHLPIKLSIVRADGSAGTTTSQSFTWGDAFVEEWRAFADNIDTGTQPKTSPSDARQDLVLFLEMIRLMTD